MKLDDEPITEEQAACLRNNNASVCSGEEYEWVIFSHKLNQLNEQSMNTLGYASCIRDAKSEIEREYQEGLIDEEERAWRLAHVMGY